MSTSPYLICEGSEASGTTTLVLNVASGSGSPTSAGDVIHVAASTSATGQTVTGVTDSNGNTYAAINNDSAEVVTYQFETTGGTTALDATDTITITFGGTAGAKAAVCIGIPGVTSGHDVAPTPVDGAAATSSSIASGTLAQANEVIIAVLSTGAQATEPAWSGSWTHLGTARQASNQWLTVSFQSVSSTSSVNATASWTASVKYCTLLASWKVPAAPPPSGLYLVGQASASAGSATLSVPITNGTSPGDTITVGAVATAGSVTGVTDTAGNSYSAISPQVGNAGDQLYVFEAYNTDAISPGGGTAGSLVGCTTTTGLYPGSAGTSRIGSANQFDTYAGEAFGLAAEKIYYQNTINGGGGLGKYPTNMNDPDGFDLTPLVTAGCQMWLCYQPYVGSNATTIASELASFQASVQFWLNNHPNGANGIRVIIYQEPQNSSWVFNSGTPAANAAAYVTMVHNYANGIRGLTDPSGRHAKVVYDSAGHTLSELTTYYPGNGFVDEISVDYYANTWANQTNDGAGPNTDPLAPLYNLALTNNKPFGVSEMGTAIVPATATHAQTTGYFNYVTTIMSAIPANLRTACMWYNANRNTPGINTIGYDPTTGTYIGAADYRAPLLQALWNALTTTTAGGITVTYSGSATGQAAIAVGDNNVQSGDDAHVGATGTSTTPSVATGTLGLAEEHIIAFFTNASAGGVAILGDGLTSASGGLSAGTGGPKLKAGFKAVNSTASDTPTATITSAAWAVSVVTHKLNVPVITNVPGSAVVGVPFSFTATATGGTGTLTWSTSGALPPGLTFTSAGVESGTPTTGGSYPYSLTVTDSLGLSSTISVVQTVIQPAPPPVTGSAPATPLEGNILSIADSDAETSSGFTWAVLANATQPTRTTNDFVAGANSVVWTALANGNTQIFTGLYPVEGGEPYICSTFLLTNQNLLCNVSINWYDSTQTLIATVEQPTNFGSVPNAWTPLSFATASPGNAAFAALVVTAEGASAGQSFSVDLSYLAQSAVQILIDWNNPTFAVGGAAGQMFMDVSPFVRWDQNLTYTRGRQDAISQVQAGSASFQLQNDLGSFTRFSTISLPASIGGEVSLQRRCQINLADQNAQWWTRFDGSISQVDYSFDNTGNTSIATITLTDVLSALNRQDPLFCWTKEQILADSPQFHWTLDDPGNAGGTGPAGSGAYGTAVESSGSNGPPMRLLNTDGTKVATIAWQDTTGGIETLADAVGANQPDGSEFWTPGLNQPSNAIRGLDAGTVGPFTTPLGGVYLTPVLTAQTSQNEFIGNNGYYLQAELPVTLGTSDPTVSYAFEVYFTMDPAVGTNLSSKYGPYIQLSLGSARSKTCIVAGLFLNSGALTYEAANYSQPPAFLGLNWPGTAPPSALASTSTPLAPDTIQRPHHLVLNMLGGSPGTVYAYLDGTLIGSFALTAGQVFDTICVGAAYGGAGAHFGGVQLASIYPQSLSPQQITLHCQLGQYGMWESPSDDALTQIASYANVPSFWFNLSAQHNGLTMMEYMDITGANALTSMQLVAQAENGLLYVDATGALNFHTRDWRMGYGAPDLVLPPGVFDADMNYELVDQFMANEAGVAGPGTTGATGTQGAAVSTTTGNVQQPTNTVASAGIQAGYVNVNSQNLYGVYASSPVSSPISLPLISFSRSYAQLGIPSLTYWPDPNLIDLAAWTANSRSDPWLFPAQLTIDLLTLDATITVTDNQGNVSQVPLGISDFYALEIDNMVTPSGTLAQSFPNLTGSLEWFIEGISETGSVNSRKLTLYVSPAETQRAWVPADPVYGVLGSTTRLGISQSDLSTPQADGKDVAHDAGPPYWPPTFSAAMNNPDGSGNAFIGSADLRGITASLQLALQPPMCNVSAISQTQSFTNGALSNPALNWDTINVDTVGGMGLYPGWPNWYVCIVPGFYELSGSVVWSQTGAGLAGYAGQAWFAVAERAAQALGAGTGTPLTVGAYVCPVGSQVRFNASSMNPVCTGSTRMYLGLGDMVALCAEQNFTSSRGTSTSPIGSQMSIRFVGLATADDRTQVNSLLSSGGTVTLNPGPTQGTFTYTNQHTYSYQGKTGFSPYGRRNTDLACFQGVKGNQDSEGSQTSQVMFNAALMASQLAGHTITSATLECTNLVSWYNTGAKLMLGYTTVTPGALTFHPQASSTTVNVMHQKFNQGQKLTFAVPISLVQEFVTGGATALVLGDSQDTDLNYYGQWDGGPGNWILTVNHK